MGQGISMGAFIAIAHVYLLISFKNCARRGLSIKRTTLGRFGGVTTQYLRACLWIGGLILTCWVEAGVTGVCAVGKYEMEKG